jgi:predicted O-methyltransferase YrrM
VTPELVRQAEALAHEIGFPVTRDGRGSSCCLPEVGRLLGMFAASCAAGRIGEVGTGVGYGAAWMVSSMPADATLVTVELRRDRADAARRLFEHDSRVTVVHGDGRAIIPAHAPFDLLFVDGGGFGSDADELLGLVRLLRIGGRIVVDDVTPVAALPADSPFRDHDAKRQAFFDSPSLWSVEVVCPDLANSSLVGTRIR